MLAKQTPRDIDKTQASGSRIASLFPSEMRGFTAAFARAQSIQEEITSAKEKRVDL
jgi:hypothetical protein